MRHESVQLEERSLVEQNGEPFAGGELPAFVLTLHRGVVVGLTAGRLPLAQLRLVIFVA